MTMTAERHMKLMAYADGELEGIELAEVEGWLAADPDAARFVTDLGVLGDFVVEGQPNIDVDLTDAIMAKVEASKVVVLAPRRNRNLAVAGGLAAALALAASVFLFTKTKEEEPLAGGGSLPTSTAAAATGTGVDVDLQQTPGQSVGVFYNETNLKTTSVTVWVDETGTK